MNEAAGVHLWSECWCGSTHSWEKAKHGTVNGLTEPETEQALREAFRKQLYQPKNEISDRWYPR